MCIIINKPIIYKLIDNEPEVVPRIPIPGDIILFDPDPETFNLSITNRGIQISSLHSEHLNF